MKPIFEPSEIETFDEVAYIYDGSLEGLLCAIYKAYAEHENPIDVWSVSSASPRLLQRVSEVETDLDIAYRVQHGLIKKRDYSSYSAVKKASLCSDQGSATAAYRFVRYAMDEHEGRSKPISNIAHPSVEPIYRICRAVDNECEKMRQFVRFEHIRNSADFWFSKVNPKHSVVPLIMNHFVERFSIQPFMIYDEAHLLCGLYDGEGCRLMQLDDPAQIEGLVPNANAEEELIQRSWKHFYDVVSVEARYNPELRRNLMPKRLWTNITEMNRL